MAVCEAGPQAAASGHGRWPMAEATVGGGTLLGRQHRVVVDDGGWKVGGVVRSVRQLWLSPCYFFKKKFSNDHH